MLLDITCDSDGTIDHYVDGDGIATTMPMPQYDADNPPMLGFFMVGAYQEIPGNMHNLFGDTEAVDVYAFRTVAWKCSSPTKGIRWRTCWSMCS